MNLSCEASEQTEVLPSLSMQLPVAEVQYQGKEEGAGGAVWIQTAVQLTGSGTQWLLRLPGLHQSAGRLCGVQ